MKLFACMLCVFCVVDGSVVFTQKPIAQPQTRLVGSEPFKIEPGRSFAASTPGGRSENAGTSTLARDQVLSDLTEAEAMIKTNYAGGSIPGPEAFTRSALVSMLHTLDPHSNFYDTAAWKALMEEEQSGYAGIGISMAGYDHQGVEDTYIEATFPGGTARLSGLEFGDRIVAVNDESMTSRPTDYVRDRIRGNTGTDVRLTVERAASNAIETFVLRRGIVPQPSIPDYYMLRPSVGYIDLSEGFNFTTDDEFSAAMRSLQRQGMTSLVLDLRGNGGGVVDQAVKVAETFLPAGTVIVSQRGRRVADSREWRSQNASPETVPLVVLVDENTASASEIVAGALQDTDRAIIVGQRTFGKGLVQNVIDLPSNTGLTLTAARYYTPSGRSIQRDYASIGRYDYYSHRGQEAAIDSPYFEARTITNRKVFGGDGIEPDEKATSDDMTPDQLALLDPIFFFVREMSAGRISGEPRPSAATLAAHIRLPNTTLMVTDQMVSDFASFLKQGRFSGVSPAAIGAEAAFIRLRLRFELVLATLGPEASAQVLAEADKPMTAAENALPSARNLEQMASRLRSRSEN